MKSVAQSHSTGLRSESRVFGLQILGVLLHVSLCFAGPPFTFPALQGRRGPATWPIFLAPSPVASAFPQMRSIEHFIIWASLEVFHVRKETHDQILLGTLPHIQGACYFGNNAYWHIKNSEKSRRSSAGLRSEESCLLKSTQASSKLL